MTETESDSQQPVMEKILNESKNAATRKCFVFAQLILTAVGAHVGCDDVGLGTTIPASPRGLRYQRRSRRIGTCLFYTMVLKPMRPTRHTMLC